MDTQHIDFAKAVAAEIGDRLAADIREGRWTPPTEYLTPEQAAAYLATTAAALETMRKERRGPKFCRPSHKIVRYARRDLDEWMNAARVDFDAG